ncbi:MAG: hypothetical protein RQ847_12465, partial [Wenzhouxiangellaceae bacterium]|nr:hypothetical protein [Wenzhouxiangellaceae bacterium]
HIPHLMQDPASLVLMLKSRQAPDRVRGVGSNHIPHLMQDPASLVLMLKSHWVPDRVRAV